MRTSHTTHQTSLGASPAELLMNRHLRTCLDLVSLNRGERVQHKEGRRKVNQGRYDLEKLYVNVTLQERIDDCDDRVKRAIFVIHTVS